IGIAEPVGLYVNTFNTCKLKDKNGKKITDIEIAEKINALFDLRPFAIIERFGLTNPIFLPTASYGHFGRDSFEEEVEVYYKDENVIKKNVNGEEKYFKKVTFFAWEKEDYVDKIKKAFEC
ncbi:MAG TPA: methionine adenosyltransferase domain-containing protein, partial [Bacteroidales bacterium]|nr:methionine adenosyltransferase domain-containing protein [Bacteroidales bacterium]